MNKFIYIFLLLGIGCAQIRSPTGGEKDTLAPQILELFPENFSTNFRGEKIVISFNEYIKLNNFHEQLLVSPPLTERPEISLKGKRLIIDLNEQLQENTTYTFNFGEGIVDNNEGNILDSNKVVFSTGPILDSLKLRGVVSDAFTNIGIEASLLLHPIGNDSSIVLKNPSYFAKSNEEGMFCFENLREGDYQLFAISDLDRDYKWSENEKMAFLNEPVSVYANDSLDHQLRMFRKEPEDLLILRSEVKNTGRVELVFNKDIDSLNFENIGFSYSDAFVNQNRKDSIIVFFDDIMPNKNCGLKILNGPQLIDTVSLFAFENTKKIEYPELSLKQINTIEQNPNKELVLETNNPIQSIDTEQIVLRIDTLIKEGTPKLKSYNEVGISANWTESNKGSLVLYPGAIHDIYEQTNDTLILRLKILDESDFGEFNIEVSPPKAGRYIFEVFMGDEVIKKENVDSLSTFQWTWFPTGEIQLRLIEDENQNGKWDSGNYFKKQQAERVWIYSEKIQIRPNWSFEQEWIIKD